MFNKKNSTKDINNSTVILPTMLTSSLSDAAELEKLHLWQQSRARLKEATSLLENFQYVFDLATDIEIKARKEIQKIIK